MRAMQSNNPVFQRNETLARSLQPGSGFHPGSPSPDELSEMYGTPQRMTLDDVIVKTGILLAIVVAVGAVTWIADVPFAIVGLAGIVGFVLALVNIFKKQVNVPLVLAYAVAQGVFVGGISAAYNGQFRGIVVQAIIGTTAIFGAVLLGYKSGKLRATPKFTKVVTFGLIGLITVGLLNLLVGAFTDGDPLGISGGNPVLTLLFTVGLIVFGALSFVLDFDNADRMVAAGVPEKEAWRVAFGLLVTLVFLYLNVLRLLSILQSD